MLALALTPVAAATDGEPWAHSFAFSLGAEDLLAGVRALPETEASAEVLLEELTVRFDASGRCTKTYHRLYRIVSAAGVEANDAVVQPWSPWYQSRPELVGRVVTPDGREHRLDPATVTDAPLSDEGDDVYSDRRIVRAPLPALVPGAVVEVQTTIADTAPYFAGGTVDGFVFGDSVPVRRTRLVLDAPSTLHIATSVHDLPGLASERADSEGRTVARFESGPIAELTEPEPFAPYDARQVPWVGWSTGKSWNEVAAAYDRLVERRLAGSKIRSALPRGARAKADRMGRLEAIVRALHRDVRYTGLEFGESSIVPASPAETLERHYGDCKDKAVLLIAMLRAAGFDARLALLSTGFGPDVDPDLPGLGAFDHAIVHVAGSPEVWIDATADTMRAGDVPAVDEGRRALIVAPATRGLVRVAERSASLNVATHEREFFLAERGAARIVSTVSGSGEPEAELRGAYVGLDAKTIKNQLGSDAKRVFGGTSDPAIRVSDVDDFTTPFKQVVEIDDGKVGWAYADAALVAFPKSDFVARLAKSLPDVAAPSDSKEPGETAAARHLPYRMPHAFRDVWTYRIHVPPGFAAASLPAPTDERVGPIAFRTSVSRDPDGTVVYKAVLDTGNRRTWSVKELEDVHAWVDRENSADPVRLVFDQLGYKAEHEGRIGDAVKDFRDLIALHPGEALHHAQLADAFVDGGVVLEARAEAKRAIALDPASAEAWRALGWASIHDAIGRQFAPGCDLAEAERAYRKSKELDSNDSTTRINLAIVLEHDPRSYVRYGSGARIDEAIDEWKALRKDLEITTHDDDIMADLARRGRFEELLRFADQDARSAANRKSWLVAATAALSGAAAALARATGLTTGPADRNALVGRAAAGLMIARRYPEAAALMKAANWGASDKAANRVAMEWLSRCRRHEEIDLGGDDPRTVVERVMIKELATPDDVPRPEALGSAEKKEQAQEHLMQGAAWALRPVLAKMGASPDLLVDLLLAASSWRVDGDGQTGYRVTQTILVPGSNLTLPYFLASRGGTLQIIGAGRAVGSLGKLALDHLEAGRIESAKEVLGWARDALGERSDSPMESPAFLAFWPPREGGGADGIRVAAAALVDNPGSSDRALKILESAAAEARPVDAWRFDYALWAAFRSRRRFDEAAEESRKLMAERPESRVVPNTLVLDLLAAGRTNEAEKVADDRMAARPGDPDATRLAAQVAQVTGRWDRVETLIRPLVDSGRAIELDYNNLAWNALVRNRVNAQAIDDAERAGLFNKSPNPAQLHTLAAVYAAAGRGVEAQRTLVKEIDARGGGALNPSEWLVAGLIAESYGATDAALEAYRRVPPVPDELGMVTPASPSAIAQARIRALTRPAAKAASPADGPGRL